MKKICIIGGGNIGSAMAASISQRLGYRVVLQTSKVSYWRERIQIEDLVTGEQSESGIIQVTSEYQEAVCGAKIIFITHPSFLIAKTLREITPFLDRKAWVGVVPGAGGAEYYAKELIERGQVFFGFDRVPYIARLMKVGQCVHLSPKTQVRIAAIPAQKAQCICEELETLLDMKCVPLKNYMTVTLTPSNPILHTSRLYSMFGGQDICHPYAEPILFYKDWTDEASELLLACDAELQAICASLKELSLEVVPLTVHYESATVRAMTEKLSSIRSLSKIQVPMKQQEDGTYLADLTSRYFEEDIPYGLCVLKAVAALCGISTPNMDKILHWYEDIKNVEYFCGERFCGKDLKDTAIAYNFGISNRRELLEFYR